MPILENSRIIFLIAGKTGGPFFPLPTISKNLKNIRPIYLGVKNGFETKVAHDKEQEIYFLPEVKLGILSFKKQKLSEFIKNTWELFISFFGLSYSTIKSLYYFWKFQPKMVITTGSFLSVPVSFALVISNFIKRTKCKLIVHQQDPEPGLANRLSARFADYKTAVFDYTIKNFPFFSDAKLIPNPIDPENYPKTKTEALKILANNYKQLFSFVKIKSDKPLLLIFGGGSGSLDINNWLLKNLNLMLDEFRIVHLTGALQQDKDFPIKRGYFNTKSLPSKDMACMLKLSDLVLCRAGLASITELKFLQKKAFLVPLPHSHQELNAKLVSNDFEILHQRDRPLWFEEIINKKNNHHKFNHDLKKEGLEQLEIFYRKLNYILDNSD